MTSVASQIPQNLILAIADMARANPPMVSFFAAEQTRRLHGQADQGPGVRAPSRSCRSRRCSTLPQAAPLAAAELMKQL
jgi:hypothetical protein